ncbi:MAG: hypothetical protein KIT11_09295 [Fimbriimonadaceae bacterium]|nr:hypothetical protein [Fimbriimonadaceae bacterium]QYK55522.1 MAG: hypothetical protein KF733_10965 [Fimbriimonadaceae bacterium]
MATLEDVREIGSTLPGTVEGAGAQFGLSVEIKGKLKGYCWSWLERLEPKKARTPNLDVLAVLVPSLMAKELLLQSNTEAFFTESHYNNYPAVLVRLPLVSKEEIEPLLIEAWRCRAPRSLIAEFERPQ